MYLRVRLFWIYITVSFFKTFFILLLCVCVCVKILIWYIYLKTENCCLKTYVKYVWMKKCVDIRVILFKNWKLLFENMYQTPPYILRKTKGEWLCLLFLFFFIINLSFAGRMEFNKSKDELIRFQIERWNSKWLLGSFVINKPIWGFWESSFVFIPICHLMVPIVFIFPFFNSFLFPPLHFTKQSER